MTAPKTIHHLIEHFEQNRDALRSVRYNEAQLRQEFLNPFFAALGWDMLNAQGFGEAYKEVIHETSVEVEGAAKAPDYAFRIGGVTRFFVEAKKPSVNIEHAIHPAYQVKRYAWSAKLPLAILSDFEEFAVYDCRSKPNPTDQSATGRVMFLTHREYIEKWDQIANIFSKDAIQKGAFDQYALGVKGKRGTKEVDDAFLEDMEKWRELLARNLALRNPELENVRQLNYAVQMTIDRIVFLRICEDRGIERENQLKELLDETPIYEHLCALFKEADKRYNSGLFHFEAEKGQSSHSDDLTLRLNIDDKVLKEIINDLYYPSPYVFKLIPTEILGQVYERFLGKVIRLTAGHQAKVEEKPEVRKAGGVYYTPTYIVDYIVRNTVGKLLEGKTPKKAAELKIVDPACGSGSFLLGAFQYLINFYEDWYIHNEPEKWARGSSPALYQEQSGDWKLTTHAKKHILLNNLHGVDIDAQAVEVTKLSLLLKVLEGESQESMGKQLSFLKERALPDLGRNIQCGNSLIGPDYYADRQMSMDFMDEEERQRVNAFDWKTAFPQVFARGGFDAVIGNPPYIRIQTLQEWAPNDVDFYKQNYKAAGKGNYDIYVIFVEKGLSLLNKNGRMGFILPHKFFNAQYGEPLRSLIASGKHLTKVVHFGDQQIFENATTYTCLMFLDKASQDKFDFEKIINVKDWRINGESIAGKIAIDVATNAEWNFTVGSGLDLFNKLVKMPTKLGDIATLFVGLQTSADTVFLFKDWKNITDSTIEVFSKELDSYVTIETDLLKPVVRSGEIGRYWANPTAQVLFPYEALNRKFILIPEYRLKSSYPKAWDYLLENKKLLTEREHGKFKDTGWYQLYPKNLDTWEQHKIMLPYMTTRLSAYHDENSIYFVNVTTGGFGLTTNQNFGQNKYITGLLNSILLNWFMKIVSTTFHGGYFAANKQFLVQLPIRTIDFSDSSDKLLHDKIVSLVERMQLLHKKTAHTPQEKESLQREIEVTDRQIDQLVYELYGLTEEEINIVEGR